MVRRIRILVLLLVSGVSVAVSGADNSVSANDESHSSLPDLASESAKKEEQENKGKTFKEQGANYFINSATQGFDNLTPEALESRRAVIFKGKSRLLRNPISKVCFRLMVKCAPVYLLAKAAIWTAVRWIILFPVW